MLLHVDLTSAEYADEVIRLSLERNVIAYNVS